MSPRLKYHVALSFAQSDKWAAEDLRELLSRAEFRVYCYSGQEDVAHGLLMENLTKIYSTGPTPPAI